MLSPLVSLHNGVFGAVQRLLSDSILALAARLAFAGALLGYFWKAAYIKLNHRGGFDPSIGGFPYEFKLFEPTAGAYAQVLPGRMEALEGDVSQLGFLEHAIVYAGTYAEFILPVLVVVGLFTRLSSLAMIGFIAVMTLVDVTGHNLSLERFFNGQDHRWLWIFALVFLVARGGGLFSVDGVLRWMRGRS